MKQALLLLSALAFIVAGAAQPAFVEEMQNNTSTGMPGKPANLTNEAEIPVQNSSENESVETEAAQFDARLATAISTVETLMELSPDNETERNLQDALGSLEVIQNSTDTASSGSNETEDEPENQTEEAGDVVDETEVNRTGTEEPEKQNNRTEEKEDPGAEQERNGSEPMESPDPQSQEEPSENAGPPEDSNRSGFMSGIIDSIFG